MAHVGENLKGKKKTLLALILYLSYRVSFLKVSTNYINFMSHKTCFCSLIVQIIARMWK